MAKSSSEWEQKLFLEILIAGIVIFYHTTREMETCAKMGCITREVSRFRMARL